MRDWSASVDKQDGEQSVSQLKSEQGLCGPIPVQSLQSVRHRWREEEKSHLQHHRSCIESLKMAMAQERRSMGAKYLESPTGHKLGSDQPQL